MPPGRLSRMLRLPWSLPINTVLTSINNFGSLDIFNNLDIPTSLDIFDRLDIIDSLLDRLLGKSLKHKSIRLLGAA